MLREVAEVLGHLGRAGRAVQADHVGPHRLERRERGADLRADEQAPGRLHRDLHHDRHRRGPAVAIARRAPMIAALPWSRSWTVSISRTSTPPASRPSTMRLVGVAELGEGDLAERRELGARARSSRSRTAAGRASSSRSATSLAMRAAGVRSRRSRRRGRTPRARARTRRTWRSRPRRRRRRSTRRACSAMSSGRVRTRCSLQPSSARPAEILGPRGPGDCT